MIIKKRKLSERKLMALSCGSYLLGIVCMIILGYLYDKIPYRDFLYIIPYGALGAAFAYINVKTDNVYSSILVHFVHNSILTIFSIISLL